jgi:hypothetical protein
MAQRKTKRLPNAGMEPKIAKTIREIMLKTTQTPPKMIDCIAQNCTKLSCFSRNQKMSPPTNGMQASAAAILEGNPVDCVVSPRGGGSGGGFGFGGIGSGAGGGDVGSKGSAMVLLDEIERLFVK